MVNDGAAGKAALICGSVAYDTLLVFPDRFEAHLLADKLSMLNVCFFVPEMRREFGGCGANIAYGLSMLGDDARVMAAVGEDFEPYRRRLIAMGMPVDHIKVVAGAFTAQAFVTTDSKNNQITAFHPGAMQQAHVNRVTDALGTSGPPIALGIVAPDGRQAMIEHAAQLKAARIPFIFDPGQQLPLFGAAELSMFVEQATWITVNDYEWLLMQQITGLAPADLTAKLEALIVTHGADGSTVHTAERRHQIPPVRARAVVDPTGCGDAYRAGLIHGLLRGLDWETTGRMASLMGSIKIGSQGPQNYSFTRTEFERQFQEHFG